MVRRIVKKSLLVFIAACSLSIIGMQYNIKAYATTEETKLENNEYKLNSEELIKVSENENLYKTSVYNNIGRIVIESSCFENINFNNIAIDILNPDINKKSAEYVLNEKNKAILIDNLQIGLTKVIIKDKANKKELCKLYIDYNKNYNENEDVGWIKSLGQWYFIDPTTKEKKTNWLLHNGHWYYLGQDGVMKNGWVLDEDKWYYLNSSGVKETGIIKDESGELYYLSENGSLR